MDLGPLPTLAVVVPLFNEAALVDRTAADILAALAQLGDRFVLVLVDNGSTDGTRQLVAQLGQDARVDPVFLPQNQGYGGGILVGLDRALSLEIHGAPAQVLGWMWGDGQVDPVVLPGLLAAVVDGATLAKAQRVRREDGRRRRVITRTYAALTHVLGIDTADVNGCPKLFPRTVIDSLQLRSTDWFLDFEAVAGVQAQGGRVVQLPAVMLQRKAGRSKVRPHTIGEFLVNLGRWRLGLRSPAGR